MESIYYYNGKRRRTRRIEECFGFAMLLAYVINNCAVEIGRR
jgi:hypothetical protein